MINMCCNSSILWRITFLRTRVSDQTLRPQHDLSHPARMKKQIDASLHYNFLPPLPSVSMLYVGHRTTDKTSFIIRVRRPRLFNALLNVRVHRRTGTFGQRVLCANISVCLLSDEDDRTRFNGETKFAAAENSD